MLLRGSIVWILGATTIAAHAATKTHAADADSAVAREVSADSPSQTIEFSDYLVLPAAGSYGRAPLHRDALEAELVTGSWKVPSEGTIAYSDSDLKSEWKRIRADPSHGLDTRQYRGGYALATVDSPHERVMFLEAHGHAAVYLNGQPRIGDSYSLGMVRLPVLLRSGSNEFLFHLSAAKLMARLVTPQSEHELAGADITLPTHVKGEVGTVWAGVPIINASRSSLTGARLECQMRSGGTLVTPVPSIPPLSVYKAAFEINVAGEDDQSGVVRLLREARGDSAQDDAGVAAPAQKELALLEIILPAVERDEVQLRTFRSSIDRSVQSYAIRPARRSAPEKEDTASPGMIVALHDAATGCEEFAARFTAKDWAHILAPGGRRPYGFDWEDWSRIDALEALADAQTRYKCDPRRVYLTGELMGGHGAWHLGVTYPSQFAAIGPISAWISFWSYGGGLPPADESSVIQEFLLRGYSPSDTIKLLGNLQETGVYILHHEGDREVPVAQARFMRSRLADFHGDFAYCEVPEHGPDRGFDTVDSPRMMDFFRHHQLPSPGDRRLIDFSTASPGVSHSAAWLSVEAQQQPLQISRVLIQCDPDRRIFAAKTINVARLSIDMSHLSPMQPVSIEVDGTRFSQLPWPEASTRLWFERQGGKWREVRKPSLDRKGPHRYGAFKSVFDNDPVLVYGTVGTKVENQWSLNKARYDAETFWYRGNGSLEVVADREFQAQRYPARNVVLYGNAETNAAWPSLLSTCPIQVRRGLARIGNRPELGDDLAVLFVHPRAKSDRALIGVVGGTGPVGMRLTSRLRYFIAGVAYPDLLLFGPGVLTEGMGDIRALGYFGQDWQVETGDIIWRDAAL